VGINLEHDTYELRLGDCLDPVTGLASLADKSVDLVVTDPPYAVSNIGLWYIGRPGKGKRRFDFFEGDADHASMVSFVVRAATESIRVMAPHASAYWWCGHREFGPLVEMFEGNGFKTRFMVWTKPSPSPPPPGSGWPSAAELCVYAFRDGRTWTHAGTNPPPSNVIREDNLRHGAAGKTEHPTQKPLATIEPLLRASSLPGQIILDMFAGSGTTGVVCRKLGRRFIGWEKDPKYFEIARKRIEATREQLELPRAKVKVDQKKLAL
jgi:DNA modification methylase